MFFLFIDVLTSCYNLQRSFSLSSWVLFDLKENNNKNRGKAVCYFTERTVKQLNEYTFNPTDKTLPQNMKIVLKCG